MVEYQAYTGWSVNVIPIAFGPSHGRSPAFSILPLRGVRIW